MSVVESFESVGILRSFYSGGFVTVSETSGMIFSMHDEGVSVVDPLSGQTHARIKVENDPIFTFAVSPRDNGEVFTIGKSNLCRHWRIAGAHEVVMERVWASGHVHPGLSMDVSHDGSLLATSSVDRSIRVFALPGYYSVAVFKVAMQDPISLIRFFPNTRALATLGAENSIAVWDLDQPSRQDPVRELKGHMSTVHAISFSPDGSRMCTSGNDQMVMSWDISAYPSISLMGQVAVFESVRAVLPLEDASSFVTGGDKGEIRLWTGKKCTYTVPSGHSAKGHVRFLYRLPQTGELLAVGVDLAISVWSPKLEFSRQLMGNLGEVLSIKFLDGKQERVLCALNDEYPRIMRTSDFASLAKLGGHTDVCLCVATNGSGGNFIATGSKDQSVRIWDADSLECAAHLTGHTGAVNCVVFTKSQEMVVSGSEDGCVKIWRTRGEKKKIIRSIIAHAKAVTALAISGNDRFIASASQDRTAKVFSLQDGALVATCSGHKGSVWSVDFSPTEQVLATASRDGTVKLWNLSAPGAPCIRTLEGHDQSVMACRFLPNGLQVVSADASGVTRLWNVRNGESGLIALTDGQVIAAGTENAKAISDDFSESESCAKIWCLDLVQNQENRITVISGTNSGTINLWTDNTQVLQESRRREKAETTEKDTAIQVLVKAKKYTEAFKTAFLLNRPKIMLQVLNEANWQGAGVNVKKFLRDCANDVNLVRILQDWQKSAKTCAIAYTLVNLVSRNSLEGIDTAKFESFAEKHMARLSSLSQKCFIIDAILLASDSA